MSTPILPDPTPAPLEGQALMDFLQGWIVGITGIEGTLVRPRWQREPGNIPEENITWIAFGILSRVSDVFAAELQLPSSPGYNELRRHEEISIRVSFYGPEADNIAHLLREGMQIGQNRELLTLNNMGLIESGDITSFPELVKDKWYYRIDMTVRIRRQIVRQYGVPFIVSGQSTLDNEKYITQINV